VFTNLNTDRNGGHPIFKYAHAMNRGLTGASAVEANNVDGSMSFFKASETFG